MTRHHRALTALATGSLMIAFAHPAAAQEAERPQAGRQAQGVAGGLPHRGEGRGADGVRDPVLLAVWRDHQEHGVGGVVVARDIG